VEGATVRAILPCILTVTLLTGTGPGRTQPGTDASSDRYSWLECQHDPAAMQWAKSRRDRAVTELSAKPEYAAVSRELHDSLAAGAPLPTNYLLGQRYLRLLRDAAHPSGLLQVAPRQGRQVPANWTTVLDIGDLNRREGKDYSLNGLGMFDFPDRCLPPAFDRCLLALSPGGSSSLELREFDLAKGAFVDGGFRTTANRSFTAWLNADTLLIAHSLLGSRALPSNFPAVARIWKRGTPLSAAKPVFEAPATASLIEFGGIGVGTDRRVVVNVVQDYSTIDYHLIDQYGTISKIALLQKVKYVGRAGLSYPYMAVQLAAPATVGDRPYPAEAIVAYDVRYGIGDAGRYSSVYQPAPGSYVSDGLDGTGSGLVFISDQGLQKTMMSATFTGNRWSVSTALSAPPGVKLEIVKTYQTGDDLLVEQQGFLTPPTVSLVSWGSATTIAATKPLIDASKYEVAIRSARSRDGTMVDYYLVRPRAPRPGPVPTLMSGYGSFGVNFDPDYFS